MPDGFNFTPGHGRNKTSMFALGKQYNSFEDLIKGEGTWSKAIQQRFERVKPVFYIKKGPRK